MSWGTVKKCAYNGFLPIDGLIIYYETPDGARKAIEAIQGYCDEERYAYPSPTKGKKKPKLVHLKAQFRVTHYFWSLDTEFLSLNDGEKWKVVEEMELIAKTKQEEEDRARVEAEEKAREEAGEKAREEAEEKAREEAEEKAREEAGEKAREEAEEKAREEAEEKAREEAGEKAREE
eukprot:GHVL01020189.1.p1 GENE.GHVL01020189.1~~GHVL01020189.1.p1  ORF type:complete len:177 (-),score=59.48 GHVL01020189.1:272-802(-)